MLGPTFREELKRLLTSLSEQHGFGIVDETIPLTRGGDCSVTLESPEFRLRFVRDKGHLFADVGENSSAEWYELNTALEYLNRVHAQAGSFDVSGLQLVLTPLSVPCAACLAEMDSPGVPTLLNASRR